MPVDQHNTHILKYAPTNQHHLLNCLHPCQRAHDMCLFETETKKECASSPTGGVNTVRPHLITDEQVTCARYRQPCRMQPERLIADDEAVSRGLAVSWLHKCVDCVNHVLPAAFTQGQGPAHSTHQHNTTQPISMPCDCFRILPSHSIQTAGLGTGSSRQRQCCSSLGS
jgi:hypothetical protein